MVDLYRVGIQAPVFSITLEGELSLALSFTDNRHLALLTDTALRVLQLDGEWLARHRVCYNTFNAKMFRRLDGVL